MVVIKTGTKTYELRVSDSGMWTDKLRNSAFLGRKKRLSKKVRQRQLQRALVPKLYADYIKSEFWKRRKKKYFKKFKKQCIICRTKEAIHLHHIVYGERGNEKDEHLAPVCEMHHTDFHEKFGAKGNMSAEWEEYLIECKN